jgi:hypothetical protein
VAAAAAAAEAADTRGAAVVGTVANVKDGAAVNLPMLIIR